MSVNPFYSTGGIHFNFKRLAHFKFPISATQAFIALLFPTQTLDPKDYT